MGDASALWATTPSCQTSPLTKTLKVLRRSLFYGQTCLNGKVVTFVIFFSFPPSFLSYRLKFHVSLLRNQICPIILYFYQFWSIVFLFLFVLILRLFEDDFFILSFSILFHLNFVSNLIIIILIIIFSIPFLIYFCILFYLIFVSNLILILIFFY
jgi:hypothetical protein